MRAQDFVKKRPTRTLSIFDIDDTLFHTTAKIKVVKDGKVLRTLTNQEFNTYELQPGEEFDFGEFRNAEKFRQESEPIEHMLDELKTILDTTKGTVIMLTARADFDDKETFLKTFTDHGIDMSRVHVHRAGNLPGDAIPAEKKAVWVRRYLDTGKYNQVSLYDDSMSNLRVFKSLKKEYPDVDFDAYYITSDDVAAVEGRGKKRRRKPKYAYGAPWGWYGMDAGYSGDGGGGDGGGGMEEMRRLKKFRWSSRSRFNNLEDSETTEASYPGNIGAMEVFKFMKVASQDQIKMLKKLIDEKEYKIAWALIQGVTGVKLQGDEFENEDRHLNIELDEGIIDSILDFLKPYVEKAQGRLKKLRGAVKQEYMETDLMWEILQKGDKARPFEIEFANKQFKDVLKGVGLGAWLSLPIPGNTLWITLLEKLLNKFDISIMPDEVKRQFFNNSMYENFADGKNPGRKGLSKRMGVNTKASVSSLRKTAKNSSGEKQRMAHWLANMKAGRNKSK